MRSSPIAPSRIRGRHSGRPASAGFTLIEVLAALTVVLIALPVAMEAISLTDSVSTRARRQLEAGSLAASKLAELVATNAWQNGNASGDFSNYSTSFPDYTWTSTVTQYEEVTTGATGEVVSPSGTSLGGSGVPATSTPATKSAATLGSSSNQVGSTLPGATALPVTLEQLDVTVSWPGRNQTFSVTVSTLIYPGPGST